MNELDLITTELMEQFKRMVSIRPLYFFEWVSYCNIFKENMKVGLNKDVKSQFLELLSREDYVLVDEGDKAVHQSIKNSLFQSQGSIKRLKPKN